MKLVKAEKDKVMLMHTDRSGKKHKVTLTVDQKGSKFVKSHTEDILYDVTNKVLRVRGNENGSTLQRVLAVQAGKVSDGRNVFFKDGDHLNMRARNLVVSK
jgi:hypothetical protein